MFANVTQPAKETIDRAHEVAKRDGAKAIGTEHLFLAILDEDSIALALLNANVDVAAVQRYLREIVSSEDLPSEARDLHVDRRVAIVLRLAQQEATSRGQPNVSLLDLLMGLLLEPRGVATQALRASGRGVEPVREHVAELLREKPLRTPSASNAVAYEAQDIAAAMEDDGVALLARAAEEASRQGYASAQPHHILLALLRAEGGIAPVAIRGVEVDPSDLCEELDRWIAPDEPGVLVRSTRVGAGALRLLGRATLRVGLAGAEHATRVDILCEFLHGGDVCLPTILERFHVRSTELEHELRDLRGFDAPAVVDEASASLSAARSGRQDEELDRALARAREEARRLGADHVGTEHLLAALALDERCAATRVLAALGVAAGRFAEAIPLPLGGCTAAEVPLTPGAERAIHLARLEARHLDHERVGTGHLLLALYWQRKGTASRVLRDLGVVPSRLRKEVLAATVPPDGSERAIYPPMTSRARAVLAQAGRLVTGPTWPAIDAGHLISALEEQRGGVADAVLRRLDIGLVPLRVWAKAVSDEFASLPRPRPFDSTLAKVLSTAWEEAERMGLDHVGTGHLLLGLLRWTNVAPRGLSAALVREAIQATLAPPPPGC